MSGTLPECLHCALDFHWLGPEERELEPFGKIWTGLVGEVDLHICSQCLSELKAKPTLQVDSIYDRNSAGCCGHIVFDDFNLEDGSIQYCLEHLKPGHKLCELALQTCLDLKTPAERMEKMLPQVFKEAHEGKYAAALDAVERTPAREKMAAAAAEIIKNRLNNIKPRLVGEEK